METQVAGERALLESMLDVQREQVAQILSEVDDTAARARLVPSLTTPLGLVKHATFVEKVWFHSRVAGVPRAELGLPDTVDESFVLAPEDTVASVREAFVVACVRSREVAAAHDLDEEFSWHRGPVSLRFVYGHMIAELARHAGHGDILVEQLKADAQRGTTATHWTLGADAADPPRLAAFWALALGYVSEPGHDDPDGASIVDPDGRRPAIGWLRVPEGKTAKNRVHVDIRVAGEPPWDWVERASLIRGKVAELLAAGATKVREEEYADEAGRTTLGHVVMLDPEGNEFCVA